MRTSTRDDIGARLECERSCRRVEEEEEKEEEEEENADKEEAEAEEQDTEEEQEEKEEKEAVEETAEAEAEEEEEIRCSACSQYPPCRSGQAAHPPRPWCRLSPPSARGLHSSTFQLNLSHFLSLTPPTDTEYPTERACVEPKSGRV